MCCHRVVIIAAAAIDPKVPKFYNLQLQGPKAPSTKPNCVSRNDLHGLEAKDFFAPCLDDITKASKGFGSAPHYCTIAGQEGRRASSPYGMCSMAIP